MTEQPIVSPEASVVAALAVKAADPKWIDTYDQPVVLYQDGDRAGVIDLQHFADGPRPRDAEITEYVYTAWSMVAYLRRFGDPDRALIRVDEQTTSIVAVLDYLNGDGDGPGWGKHTVTLTLEATDEWRAWTRNSNQMMEQADFAEFIEGQLPVFREPDGATMLEIAQSMQGANRVRWQKATRLSNGETKFEFIEDIEAKAGQRGDIAIPEQFLIHLRPFAGGSPFALAASLRWRVYAGVLRIGYVLTRPQDVATAAFASVVTAMREQLNPGESNAWQFIEGRRYGRHG